MNSITDSIPHINVFNCDLNIDIVTSRVKNRNIEGHRFDSMSETNLENNLRINYANLKKIRNLIDDNIITKNIDMSLEFHYNLDFILGLLICD